MSKISKNESKTETIVRDHFRKYLDSTILEEKKSDNQKIAKLLSAASKSGTGQGSETTPLLELEEYGYGEYPYVTTQATNNGVEGLYNYYTEEGGVLTVDSAVLGYCSYQSYNFSASDD